MDYLRPYPDPEVKVDYCIRTLHTAYWCGDVVYLKLRQHRDPGMVTAVNFCESGYCYSVTWGTSGHETRHYEGELTAEFVPDYGASDAE